MKLFYFIIGLVVFFVVSFCSINFASLIGEGKNSEVSIIASIAMLCSIIVFCTLSIKDEIRNLKK